ncbi:MAG: autotransporter domain-containing protein [Gammaproteobacteria bacterium]|nr:autotransporter domain-containing protein [Gammaproteobacteria bacterium]
MKTARFPRNRLSHAIAIALTTAISGPAMAGTGSCGNGTTVISSAATTACVLEDGDSLEISDSGSIQITTPEAAVYSSGMPTIGSVNNKGLIKSASSVGGWGTGIFLQDTTVTGDVNNSGTIESHYTAISLGDVGGDVINSGSIVSDSGTGIISYERGTVKKIAGDVVNSGTIESHYTGILLTDVGGDVINSGHIDAESYSGMYLYGEIGGDIVNSGTIEAHDDYGIGVASVWRSPGTSSVGGDIINSGTISSYDHALYIDDSKIGGSIINTGTMRSDDDGIYLYDSTVGGKIDNSGLIQAGDGYEGIYVYDATVTGGIHNSGSIVALGSGTAIHYESPNGVIHNSGKISGNAAILGDKDMTLNLYAGSNISGTIDLDNSGTDVAGDVVNIYSGNSTLTVVGAETVNFLGGGIVSGTTITSVDATASMAHGLVTADLGGSVHNNVNQRMVYKPQLQPVQVAALGQSPGMLFQGREPTAWVQAFGGKRERDADGNVAAYDHSHYGVNIGYEWDIQQRRVGLMAGFARSDIESDLTSFETEADSFYVGGYSHFDLGSVNLTASLIGGYSDYDNKRYVFDNINGLETASSDFDGTFLSPSVTVSAAYALRDGFELRPSLNMTYNVAWMDDYSESGTTRSNLSIGDSTARTLSTRLQLAIAKQPDPYSEVEMRIGLTSRHSDNDKTHAVLAGNSFSFDSAGDDSELGGYVGFNYRIATKDNLDLVADLESGVSDDETYIQGQLSLEYKF